MSRPSSSSRASPATPASDLIFPDPPTANVAAIAFSPTRARTSELLVASWDHAVHHYQLDVSAACSSEAVQGEVVRKVQTFAHEAPVLDVCFVSDELAASAGVDRRVRLLDLRSGKSMILGKHEDAVLKLRWCAQTRLLVSGSADRTLCFWDLPLDAAGEVDTANATLLKTLAMPDKVIVMDISPPFFSTEGAEVVRASQPGKQGAREDTPRLVVGMAGRHVHVYELMPLRRAMDRERSGQQVAERDWQPDQKRESSLKFMARDLRCMPAGDGYATSSIEGRIAVEFFDPSPAVQALKYAFKCHRETIQDDDQDGPHDVVYPVHAIAFHPTHGTFASLGGDAVVSVWDAAAKKRIRQYPPLASTITAASFDPSGHLLLIATGSAAIQPTDSPEPIALIAKTNAHEECKPKPKSSSKSSSHK